MKQFNITVNGQAYQVEVEEVGGSAAPAAPRAAAPRAAAPAPAPAAAPAPAPAPAAAPAVTAGAGEHAIAAPMPGKVLKVNVTVGQAVKSGDVLLILEAMKMQNEIMADADGTVKAIAAQTGANVAAGDNLIILG